MVLLVGIAWARPEPNAFLNQEARTTLELVRQFRRDPQVRDRFLRHYGLDRAQADALLNSLRPGKLAETGIWPVYSAQPDGSIKMKLQKLAKGTGVFVNSHGQPVLKLSCGNPMGKLLQSTLSLVTIDSPLASLPNEALRDLEPPNAFAEFTDNSMPVAWLEPEVPEVGDVTEGESGIEFVDPGLPILTGTPGTPFRFPFEALIPFAFIDSDSDDDEEFEPIPEPATLTALLAGVGYLAIRKRRSKR